MTLDCIVIGAGAAGIGAGLALQQHNVSFVILESKNRLGGRAYTEVLTSGQVFDHGCHWFHFASKNPLRKIALELNHPFTDKTAPYTSVVWRDGSFLEESSLDSELEVLHDRIMAAGRRGEDVAAAEFLDQQSWWANSIRHDFALTYSQELEAISTVEAANFQDTGENIPVSGGYGSLIAHMGAPLPVQFNSNVSLVELTQSGVRIEMKNGALDARAVIVAVPQRVLSRERLKFKPGLPVAVLEAIDSIPMGWFEKTALTFDRPVFGRHGGGGLEAVANIAGMDWPIAISLGHGDNPIAIAHLAGHRARDMSMQERVACCEEALAQCFGSDIRARITQRKSTNWRDDPDVGGAYSCAKPGYAHMRKRLLDPIHGRIFLAGEHTSLNAMATAHGAYVSGQSAAQAVLRTIGQEL